MRAESESVSVLHAFRSREHSHLLDKFKREVRLGVSRTKQNAADVRVNRPFRLHRAKSDPVGHLLHNPGRARRAPEALLRMNLPAWRSERPAVRAYFPTVDQPARATKRSPNRRQSTHRPKQTPLKYSNRGVSGTTYLELAWNRFCSGKEAQPHAHARTTAPLCRGHHSPQQQQPERQHSWRDSRDNYPTPACPQTGNDKLNRLPPTRSEAQKQNRYQVQ